MTDRAENNRKLAEWLEPLAEQDITRVNGEAFAGTLWTAGHGWNWTPELDKFYPRYDFYTDESANALLLEKMVDYGDPILRHENDWPTRGWWFCSPCRTKVTEPLIEIRCTDRKTAICEAALALIESEAPAPQSPGSGPNIGRVAPRQ